MQREKLHFVHHIFRGSSGEDFVAILEGNVEVVRLLSAHGRKWTDDTREWANINEYFKLKRQVEYRDSCKILLGNL